MLEPFLNLQSRLESYFVGRKPCAAFGKLGNCTADFTRKAVKCQRIKNNYVINEAKVAICPLQVSGHPINSLGQNRGGDERWEEFG